MAGVANAADRDRATEPAEHQSSDKESSKRADRRAFPRHAVDCPVTVIPVGSVGQIAGHLSDLSMGGCLVRLEQRYLAGMLVRVEVQFRLRGIAFRILGVTVGTRGALSFAVRFLEVPQRRREALAEVLEEVAAINALHAIKAAAEEGVASGPSPEDNETIRRAQQNEPLSQRDASGEACAPAQSSEAHSAQTQAAAQPAATHQTMPQTAPAKAQERRTHSRHAVDTSVRLLLIKSAIAMTGRIANLSLGGCRIRTDERFSVGIFVRVETEFYLHGLPFRIAGVSQAVQDKNTIGIRFLDMSERCRAQLVELIAEIEEAHALESDGAPEQAEGPVQAPEQR